MYIDVTPLEGPPPIILKKIKNVLEQNDLLPDIFPSKIMIEHRNTPKETRTINIVYQDVDKYTKAMRFNFNINIEDDNSEQEGIITKTLKVKGSFKKTDEEKVNSKLEKAYRTLVVSGIPLTIDQKNKDKIKDVLKKFREIESMNLVEQRVKKDRVIKFAMFHQAYVVFKNKETIDNFFRKNGDNSGKWSILVDTSALTVMPLKMTKTEFEE